MPADRLTTIAVHRVADAVLAVLAGNDPHAVATTFGMHPDDLGDAIEAYHTAGTAALEQQASDRWYHARIRFTNWDNAEHAAATRLGPRLDQLQADGILTDWWFLRKRPCWRIRLLDADAEVVGQLLDELTAAGVIAGWRPGMYEPETSAFGGPAGTDIAHDLFCADSHGVLDYARRDSPPLGRRELSVLLISAILATAGLDWFERADVFDRVARIRPAPGRDDARVRQLATHLRPLLAQAPSATLPVFAPGGPAAFAGPWLAAFQEAGSRFGEAASNGLLDRGVRAVLAHVVIFHWNRLGLLASTQGTLARAATTALLPPG
jgi:thiopeptide-type bacteriocin biosynthesis protein